jgi:hypothetical protein
MFFLLVFSIIEFGRYIYIVQVMNNAAREGARYAIVHGARSLSPSGPKQDGTCAGGDCTGNNVRNVVRNFAVGVAGSNISFPNVGCVHGEAQGPCWQPGNERGYPVQVTVRTTFQTLIPLVPLPTITIDGASTLVVN